MNSLAVKNIYKHKISLRKEEKNLIQHLKHLGFSREPVNFECFGNKWFAKFSRIYKKKENLEEIFIDWGGADCIIRIPQNWLTDISSHVLGFDYVFNLPDELREFVFEVCADEFFGPIENSTRKRFRFNKSKNDQINYSIFYGFDIQINDGSHDFNVEFWVDTLGLGFLANSARGIGKIKREINFWNEIPISVRFLIGWTEIKKECLKNLSKFDVILLDESYLNDGKFLRVVLGDAYISTAEILDTGIIFSGPLEKIMKDFERGNSSEDIDLDDLQICLSFDLGERTLSLGELRSISSGYVFELGRNIRNSVFIRANGKHIGEGELVDIEGNIGVSVLRFSEKS